MVGGDEVVEMVYPVLHADDNNTIDFFTVFKMFNCMDYNRLVVNLQKLFGQIPAVHTGSDSACKNDADIHNNSYLDN